MATIVDNIVTSEEALGLFLEKLFNLLGVYNFSPDMQRLSEGQQSLRMRAHLRSLIVDFVKSLGAVVTSASQLTANTPEAALNELLHKKPTHVVHNSDLDKAVKVQTYPHRMRIAMQTMPHHSLLDEHNGVFSTMELRIL